MKSVCVHLKRWEEANKHWQPRSVNMFHHVMGVIVAETSNSDGFRRSPYLAAQTLNPCITAAEDLNCYGRC